MDIGLILIIAGAVIIVITSILTKLYALSDDNVDKVSFFFGVYIFKYKLSIILILLGLLLLFTGIGLKSIKDKEERKETEAFEQRFEEYNKVLLPCRKRAMLALGLLFKASLPW